MSLGYFTHATPTLFNAGSPRPQMSSCYLIACGDSIDDIAENMRKINALAPFKLEDFVANKNITVDDVKKFYKSTTELG